MEWMLEIALLVLLGLTLFHAVRLERALGVLKRDRAMLEELVAGFNGATRQAETGIERLRAAADGAGRQIARHIDAASALKEDLLYLADRGDKLADRLDQLVRSGRAITEPMRLTPVGEMRGPTLVASEPAEKRVRSQAERDLLKALKVAR